MRCWNVFYWKQPQQLAQQVAFVTTERIRISNLACRDVVALGRAPYTNWIGRMQAEDEAIVMQSLEKVGMASYAFRTMANQYELCHLLADLAHQDNKCIMFSTHELDIAQSLCDTIALIDSPTMHHLPTQEMIRSGHIDKLFKIQNKI